MIQIREYHEGDEEGIKSLINSVLIEYDVGQPVDDDKDLNNISESFDFEDGGGFWVLDDDGKIVGTIGVRRLSDDACYFLRFYLHKDYRGKGWGSKLWHHRAKWLKRWNYKKAYATSNAKFVTAIRFYDSHGYERITKEELPVPVNWADVFYVKDLSS